MTKISIASAAPTSDLQVAKFLHQRFKMSLIGSQKKLAMGNKSFFTRVTSIKMIMLSVTRISAT